MLRQDWRGASSAAALKRLLYFRRVQIYIDYFSSVQPVLDVKTASDNSAFMPDIRFGGSILACRPIFIDGSRGMFWVANGVQVRFIVTDLIFDHLQA
jgi:hypothetical protein